MNLDLYFLKSFNMSVIITSLLLLEELQHLCKYHSCMIHCTQELGQLVYPLRANYNCSRQLNEILRYKFASHFRD